MNIVKRVLIVMTMAATLTLGLTTCSFLKSAIDQAASLKNLKFKLENVNGFKLNGVNLSDKSSLKSFSLTDGLALTKCFTSKTFPSEFTLNVAAQNPNTGSSGTQKSILKLQNLEWQLIIDGVTTINGALGNPVDIPASGQSTIIPLRMSIDLYKFFASKGYENVVNLALAIGGVSGSTSKLKLVATPTVSTPVGVMLNPGQITIVDTQFN